jgi:hypothetical protein
MNHFRFKQITLTLKKNKISMKKLLVLFTMLAIAYSSNAQSLDDIEKLMLIRKFADAKTSIDKIMADPKNATKAVNHYYKGRIYNAISKEPGTKAADAFSLKQTAYQSFQKNQELDKKDERMKGENYESYFDLFGDFYNLGATVFNAAEKDYALAYKSFAKAEEIEQFIFTKGYKFAGININKLDTNLIINMGKAAFLAKDSINGIVTYRRIADANIAGAEQEWIYQSLASYYIETKDDANFSAMVAKGKMLYPKNPDWNGYEIDKVLKEKDKATMLKKLDELYVKDPTNYDVSFNYAVEMYNLLHASKGTDAEKKLVNSDRLTTVIKSAMANNKDMNATSILVRHLYNTGVGFANESITIKNTKPAKPADVKRKKELIAAANAKYEEAFPYADKMVKYYQALPKMKDSEKVGYREVLGVMRTYYEAKNDVKKAAEYDKLRDAIKF